MSVEAKQAKQVIIDEIKAKLDKAQSAVVIDYIGTTVEEANAMRKKLREADVDYTVYKNTLMKRAIAGTVYEPLAEVLEGPSAIAISYDDATAPARVLNDAIKEYKKMEFKGGVVEGEFRQEKFSLLNLWEAFSHLYQRLFVHSRQSQMQKLNN